MQNLIEYLIITFKDLRPNGNVYYNMLNLHIIMNIEITFRELSKYLLLLLYFFVRFINCTAMRPYFRILCFWRIRKIKRILVYVFDINIYKYYN